MLGGRQRISPTAATSVRFCGLPRGQTRRARWNRDSGQPREAAVGADAERTDHVGETVVGVEVPAVLTESEVRGVRPGRVRGLREDERERPVLVDREGRD